MFIGGMAGSTSGSVKVYRLDVLYEASRMDVRRLMALSPYAQCLYAATAKYRVGELEQLDDGSWRIVRSWWADS